MRVRLLRDWWDAQLGWLVGGQEIAVAPEVGQRLLAQGVVERLPPVRETATARPHARATRSRGRR